MFTCELISVTNWKSQPPHPAWKFTWPACSDCHVGNYPMGQSTAQMEVRTNQSSISKQCAAQYCTKRHHQLDISEWPNHSFRYTLLISDKASILNWVEPQNLSFYCTIQHPMSSKTPDWSDMIRLANLQILQGIFKFVLITFTFYSHLVFRSIFFFGLSFISNLALVIR